MIGGRRNITKFYEKCRKLFCLGSILTDTIIILTIKCSFQMIQNHMYNRNSSLLSIFNERYKSMYRRYCVFRLSLHINSVVKIKHNTNLSNTFQSTN